MSLIRALTQASLPFKADHADEMLVPGDLQEQVQQAVSLIPRTTNNESKLFSNEKTNMESQTIY